MGTARRAIKFPSNFQGPKEAHQTAQRVCCSSKLVALSHRKDLQGSSLLRRKENSSWDLALTSLSSVVLPHNIPASVCNFNHILFRAERCRRRIPLDLRTESLMTKCCSHETLLHFSLQSSHLNSCYYHQDLH